jgi:LuxR family maltose regulon positive regulatory protein
LHQLLDAVVRCPLTLVVAPAGAGKTALLSGWVAETSIATAWLSLDDADRDGTQLWSGVIEAVESLAPGSGQPARHLLMSSATLNDVVRQLLNDLDALDLDPSVLVLDDVHLVDDETEITASLGLFLQHLPPWLHVVLLSRHDPRIPVDRQRARGQLGEVRFAELKFSPAEAAEMLSRLAPTLSDEQIDAAAVHVEGWAAGLQMTALAARSTRAQQGAEAPRSESELLVHDYMWREVLASEDADLVEAMLDMCVVGRVSGSLARALTGRADAHELLLRAEARGLFLTRLGVDGWFGVHSLIRAALLAELTRRSPERLAEQHARAARWLEDEGEVTAALEHWLCADRPRDALHLLAAKHPALYDSGRESITLRTIAAIPSAVAASDVESMIEFAWCHVLVSRRRFAEAVEKATWLAASSPADEVLGNRLTVLRSMSAAMTGNWVEGGALAREAMRAFGESWWRDPLGRFVWNMVGREIALSERWDDQSDDVRGARLALSRDPERGLALEGIRSFGEALAGRPVDALRVAAGVRHAATVANMTILRAELAMAEAIAHRELGDRARAEAELREVAEMPAEATLYCRVLALLELTQAGLDEGDVDAARRMFEQAESLVVDESFGSDGRMWLARVGTLLELAAGDVDAARQWAAEIDDPFWGGVSWARIHLAAGDRAQALAALDTVEPRCVRHEVVASLLRARATTDHDEAEKHAASAVELATTNGLLQTVAAEDREAVELVERAAWQAPVEWMDRLRRAAAERRVRAHNSPIELIEPLTERERDVLRFLPSRLTVREIADELYVSVNTLKFHLKVIYRKLGVNSRAEAAEIARAMTLVRR